VEKCNHITYTIVKKWKRAAAMIKPRKQINTNRKGSKFVDKVKKYLEDRGYIVIKVSASKPFDLVAWIKDIQVAMLFECRTQGSVAQAFRDLWKASLGIDADRFVVKPRGKTLQVWQARTHGHAKIELYVLTEDFRVAN